MSGRITPQQIQERRESLESILENMRAVRGEQFTNLTHAVAKAMLIERLVCQSFSMQAEQRDMTHAVLHSAFRGLIDTLIGMYASDADAEEAALSCQTMIDVAVID